MAKLKQLTILAPGLLGGSVARAAHARGVVDSVVLWARRPEVRLKLREQPWCTRVCDTPEQATEGASLVIIAAPVDRIAPLAGQIAPALRPDAVVTDVGSVKGEIARAAGQAIPAGRFVGSHPMAGGEKTGWEHSTPELFNRRTCFVTPVSDTAPEAVNLVVEFWRDLGAEVVTVDADRHDEIVAHISHLPQAIATTLCSMLARKNNAWRNYAGGGLRDTTRIAASDAQIWRSIFEQNRDEVLRALHDFEDELHGFRAALANRDYVELAARMERAKAYRDQFRPVP